jgi:hypothetical protein
LFCSSSSDFHPLILPPHELLFSSSTKLTRRKVIPHNRKKFDLDTRQKETPTEQKEDSSTETEMLSDFLPETDSDDSNSLHPAKRIYVHEASELQQQPEIPHWSSICHANLERRSISLRQVKDKQAIHPPQSERMLECAQRDESLSISSKHITPVYRQISSHQRCLVPPPDTHPPTQFIRPQRLRRLPKRFLEETGRWIQSNQCYRILRETGRRILIVFDDTE